MWQPSRRRGRGCYVQTWKSGNRPLLTRVKSFKYAEQNNTTQSHTRTIFACISTKHTSQGHELHTLLANFRKNRGEVPPKMVTITPPSIHHHHRSTTIIDPPPSSIHHHHRYASDPTKRPRHYCIACPTVAHTRDCVQGSPCSGSSVGCTEPRSPRKVCEEQRLSVCACMVRELASCIIVMDLEDMQKITHGCWCVSTRELSETYGQTQRTARAFYIDSICAYISALGSA